MGCPNFFKYHPEATIGEYCERFGYEEERLVETISGSAQFLVGRGTIKEALIDLDSEKLTDTLYNKPDPIEQEHIPKRPEPSKDSQKDEEDKPEEEEPEYRTDYTSEEEEEEDKLKDYKEEESGEEVLLSNLFRQIGLADELYSFC